MRAEKLHSAEMMSVSEKYRNRSALGISNERDMVTIFKMVPPPCGAPVFSCFSHFSFRSLSESFGCKVFSLSVYSSNLRNFSHHIIKGLYATFSSWHIDPCCFLFILSIVLNKISTFLFNTNDFQPFSPAIRWEYNQKRSLYICNKAQPSHEDCASNSFLFLFNF